MSVKPIVPANFNIKEHTDAIDAGLLDALEEGKVLLKLSYHNWSQQPEFEVSGPKNQQGKRVVEYSTESTPWVFVDEGTKPHTEHAKNFLRMKFTTDSVPKTQRGQLLSSAGNRGSNWVSAIEVHNPGIEKREFSLETAKRLEDEIIEVRVQKRISEVD